MVDKGSSGTLNESEILLFIEVEDQLLTVLCLVTDSST